MSCQPWQHAAACLFNLSLSAVAQCYHLARLHQCLLVLATIKDITLLDESPLSMPEIKRPLPLIRCPICGQDGVRTFVVHSLWRKL
jgi:hypothetical protein